MQGDLDASPVPICAPLDPLAEISGTGRRHGLKGGVPRRVLGAETGLGLPEGERDSLTIGRSRGYPSLPDYWRVLLLSGWIARKPNPVERISR